MNPKVDEFLDKEDTWQEELRKLRQIVLACNLTEELKWGQPCYTIDGKNIVIIHGFKEYCALLFIKGALMKDPGNLLIQQTENVQAGRQIRFSSIKEINGLEDTLKAYVQEAIRIEKAGLQVEKKKTSDFPVPEEFQVRLDGDPALKSAFDALTPGRQRGYLFYFSQPKQSKTREARVEKCIPRIFDGLGLDD
ncbi:MAG TPA: YdeI family protein [bacterium]|nr:YdeI family protein [bacterium]